MNTGAKVLTTVLFFVVIFSANSQSLERLKAFTMTIHGTSTLHDWQSKVTKADWSGSISFDESKNITVRKSDVRILVKDIQSEHGRIMDNKTYEAFNADKNPNITFSMKSFLQKNDQLSVEGTLTMNGSPKTVSLIMNAKVLGNGDVQFTGSYNLKMTDFKMTPPTAMMGTIKVADAVTVKFDLTVSK